jgi:hypothetical protein
LGVANHRVFGICESLRMKAEFRRHGLPCSRHRLLRPWNDAEALIAEIGLPVVVKPPAGSNCEGGWRGGAQPRSIDERSESWGSPENPALAEEMLVGREFRFNGPHDRCYAVGCAYLRGVGCGRVPRDVGIAVRNPDTEVVLAAMRTITEPIAIEYGG